MVTKNEKSMMKLVRLPILRLLLLKREISRGLESLNILRDSYGWVASLATQPYKPFKFFEFSNYHKISRLRNRGLKIGNLANFIMLFPFLATMLYYHLFYD